MGVAEKQDHVEEVQAFNSFSASTSVTPRPKMK
jgi:hypothetical protein